MAVPSQGELEAAQCWVGFDLIPGRPALTNFRRAVRYHQAKWREANGYPIGTHRSRPGAPAVPVGSRLELDFARETGATFLTAKAIAAARERTSFVEAHQRFDHQGFWADLMSSEALAVNLFGDLAADLERADRAVRRWWPDAPGRVSGVRFAHSPGRFDPTALSRRDVGCPAVAGGLIPRSGQAGFVPEGDGRVTLLPCNGRPRLALRSRYFSKACASASPAAYA